MKNQNFTGQWWDRKHQTKHAMIGFTFIFHCTIIYIYCIYSLNCLWQQIKSDIHVKFILIKLYKNCLLWENTATPQIFIPEDRQMDRSMAGEETLELSCTALRGQRLLRFLRHFTTAQGKQEFFHGANSNINGCTNKINIYALTLTRPAWWNENGDTGARMCWRELQCFVQRGGKYKCQNRQSLRGIIHGCFQVCKHLISCILQCAIRDHLGHICCKLKHFKVEATLRRKTQRPAERRQTLLQVAKLESEMSMFNI